MLELIFGRKIEEPERYRWELLKVWFYATEEEFYSLYNRRREAYEAARNQGTEKRFEAGMLSAQEAWDEIRKIHELRRELICRGWLPPRERDICASQFRPGSPSHKSPAVWAAARHYGEDELPKFSNVRWACDQ